ncbi:MAG: hypothetical protein IT452_07200 [Planctomycetia bacterium]|nr:hypothetical protein [Planctomycetia bacterium]
MTGTGRPRRGPARTLALLLAMAALAAAEESVLMPRSAVSMPRPDSVDRAAVLTNTGVDDPWAPVVAEAARRRGAAVVRFAGDDPAAARAELAAIAPGTVTVVVRPETLDVDFVYRLLEIASSLDADFALDFRLGFVTGVTPEAALALLANEKRVEAERALLPKKLVDFGPSEADLEVEGEQTWLEGWERLLARHLKPSEADVKRLEGAGVLQFWGYGRPEGIAGSVDAEQLAVLDLFPAVAFGGPVYSGVTNRWYEGPVSAAPRAAKSTPVEKSFALALLARGATAFFGATDPGHGVTAMQEMELMVARGLSVGETHKSAADAALLQLRQAPLRLPRIAEGTAAPNRDWADPLARGALSRIGFGDPDYRPFDPVARQAWRQDTERLENGIRVRVTIAEAGLRATLTDVFQYGFGRKDALLNARVLTQVEWPDDMPLPVKLRVLDAKSGGRDVRVGPATAAVEYWGAKRVLHVQLDFPAQTLVPGTEIRFLLRTGAAGEDQDRETLFESARGAGDAIQAARDAAGTAAGGAEPLRWNAWDGAAGVALFQMSLMRATGDGNQGARARALLDAIVAAGRREGAGLRWDDTYRLADSTLATMAREGLHSGAAGIAGALLEGFRIFGDRRYLDAAVSAAEAIEARAVRENGQARWGDDTTVAGGAAGIALFLFDLADASGESRWRDLALEAVAWLEAVRTELGGRCWWRAQLSLPRVYTGITHGAAGISLAFLRAHAATRDDRWLATPRKVADWLVDQARRSDRASLWPAVTGEGPAAAVPGFSFGTAGVGRFFARLFVSTRDVRYLDFLREAAAGAKRAMDQAERRPFDSADLASGGAGLGELFLDAFELTRDGAWLEEARRVADVLRTQAGPAPGPWAERPEGSGALLPWDGEGLYPGAAGLGMFYLRLATIDMEAGRRPRQPVERR